MGKSLVTAALVFMPLIPNAKAHAEELVVEYAGVVSSIDRASSLAPLPPYEVGDTISGRLIIDTAFLPTDRVSDDPTVGRYYGGSSAVDFIFGAPHPPSNAPADLLVVYNDYQPPTGRAAPEDGIVINDSSGGVDGKFNLVLGFRQPNSAGQVFADDSAAQSFVVENEPGATLWGYIEQGFGEFWNVVDFTIDRLSVTPRVCAR